MGFREELEYRNKWDLGTSGITERVGFMKELRYEWGFSSEVNFELVVV